MMKTPFERLTEEDIELIRSYIKCFASENMDVDPDIDRVLNEWDTAKTEHLVQLFGEDALILSKEIDFNEPTDKIRGKIDKLFWQGDDVSLACQNFRNWFNRAVDRMFPMIGVIRGEDNVWRECHENIDVEGRGIFDIMLNTDSLVDNVLPSNLEFSLNGVDKKYKFPKGTRIMRVLGKIVPEFYARYKGENDGDVLGNFEKFRIAMSMTTNNKAQHGTLCLSIHPMDFMTMSDNASEWSSCMRWGVNGNGFGEYRIGTVSNMNSPYCVVGYLHNPNDPMNNSNTTYFPRGKEWNNKKWRCLFLVENEVITEVKGYPYDDKNMSKMCLDWLRELAHKNLGWDYDDKDYINIEEDIDVEKDAFASIEFDARAMYNDFGTLREHLGAVNRDKLKVWLTGKRNRSNYIHLPYDGLPTCMCCGGDIDSDGEEDSNMVICSNCDPRGGRNYCECCGDYFYGEGYHVIDYEYDICPSCFENYATYDEIAEEDTTADTCDIYLKIGEYDSGEPILSRKYITAVAPTGSWDYENWRFADWRYYFNGPALRTEEDDVVYVTLDMFKIKHSFGRVRFFDYRQSDIEKEAREAAQEYDCGYTVEHFNDPHDVEFF